MTAKRASAPAALETAGALRRVIDETRRTFHRLARVAERLHEVEELTAGERGVLLELAEGGPKAVPAMARSRPVSRQHIQTLVNALLDRSLVELVPNPRHERSMLVQVTSGGQAVARQLLKREKSVLTAIAADFEPTDLERTARTLARLSQALEDVLSRTPESTRRSHE